MNYVDALNLLKTYGGASNNAYTTWCNDDEFMKIYINDDTIHSIWHSDGRNEIEVKEEKKNAKTESQHPDDGCIYW